MQIAVSEIVTNALRLCGQMGAPGRGHSTAQQTEVLGRLNRMLDGWNALRANIYQVSIEQFTLTPHQQTYTIGEGGNFNTTRPVEILKANMVLTSVSPNVRAPLEIINWDRWGDIPVPSLASSLPVKLYVDSDFPLRKLYLWGYSSQQNNLELFMTKSLPVNLLISDTITVPDGYIEAIEYSLAERIAPLYWRKANGLLEDVRVMARKARAAIQSANSKPLNAHNDAHRAVGAKSPYFNYLVGR